MRRKNVLLLLNAQNERNPSFKVQTEDSKVRKNLWKYGVICGIALFFGFGLQQGGIAAYPSDASAKRQGNFGMRIGIFVCAACADRYF